MDATERAQLMQRLLTRDYRAPFIVEYRERGGFMQQTDAVTLMDANGHECATVDFADLPEMPASKEFAIGLLKLFAEALDNLYKEMLV